MDKTYVVFYLMVVQNFSSDSLIKDEWDIREWTFQMLFCVWSCSFDNWNFSVGRTIWLNSKEYIGMHSFTSLLILYEGIWWENIMAIQSEENIFTWCF